MHTPLSVKIRLSLVLALSWVIFAMAGRSAWLLSPSDVPFTIVFRHQRAFLVIITASLVLVATVLAIVLAGRYARHIALVAAPAGLSAWAVTTAGIDRLFLIHYQQAQRTAMFLAMLADLLPWFALVFLGYLITILFTRQPNTNRPPELQKAPPEKSKSTASQNRPKTRPKKPILFTDTPWFRSALGVILTCTITVVLLKILLQSGQAHVSAERQQMIRVMTVPRIGQIIFAVITAFLLGTSVSHQLLKTPLWPILAAPPLVAALAYLFAARLDTTVLSNAPLFVPSAAALATVLPMQYVSLGSLAVIAGFWFSVRTSRIRRHARFR